MDFSFPFMAGVKNCFLFKGGEKEKGVVLGGKRGGGVQ